MYMSVEVTGLVSVCKYCLYCGGVPVYKKPKNGNRISIFIHIAFVCVCLCMCAHHYNMLFLMTGTQINTYTHLRTHSVFTKNKNI